MDQWDLDWSMVVFSVYSRDDIPCVYITPQGFSGPVLMSEIRNHAIIWGDCSMHLILKIASQGKCTDILVPYFRKLGCTEMKCFVPFRVMSKKPKSELWWRPHSTCPWLCYPWLCVTCVPGFSSTPLLNLLQCFIFVGMPHWLGYSWMPLLPHSDVYVGN